MDGKAKRAAQMFSYRAVSEENNKEGHLALCNMGNLKTTL